MKKIIMIICLLSTLMYANQPGISFVQQHKDINASDYNSLCYGWYCYFYI